MKKLTLTLLFAVVAVAMQAATVYLKIGEGQVKADSNIGVWIWNSSQNFTGGTWPGAKLTETKTVGDSEYFVYSFETESAYNLIFNANGGSGQTANIEGLTGDNTFVLNSDWSYTKTPGAPDAGPVVEEPAKVQLIGAHYGNWIAADAPEFTYDEATETYTYVETTTANLADGFKILVDGDWRGNTEFKNKALAEANKEFVSIAYNMDGNMNLTDASDYTKITLTVKKVEGVWSMQILGEKAVSPVETVVTMTGDNYADAPAFTFDETNQLYTYTESDPSKLASFNVAVDGANYGNAELTTIAGAADFVALSQSDAAIALTDVADYKNATLTVKKEGDVWMLKIEGEKKETPVETHTVQILGEAYTWKFETAPAFTYNEETKEYVYIEETPANLAKHFKLGVDNTWRATEAFENVALASATTDFVAIPGDLAYGQNMYLTDAADYKAITVTVKLDGDAWMVKIAGDKGETPVETHVVKIKGVFNGWKLADLEGADGIYTITVTENVVELADAEGFGFEIDGVYYAGDIELELDGDAVAMTANPMNQNIKLANDGKYAIILTVAKKGSDWTVQAATGNPSAVEAIDAENVNVVAGNGEIVVEGAQSVAVYTVAGALVSTDALTRVAAGLYIVRADNVVKKVLVK